MVRARIQKTFWKVVFLEFSQCFLKRTMQYPFYFKELKKRDFSIFPVFFRVVQSFKREVFFSTLQYLDIVGVLAISNVLKIRIFKKETLYLFHQRYFHKVLNDLDYLFVVKSLLKIKVFTCQWKPTDKALLFLVMTESWTFQYKTVIKVNLIMSKVLSWKF